jgi:hypothetical protein
MTAVLHDTTPATVALDWMRRRALRVFASTRGLSFTPSNCPGRAYDGTEYDVRLDITDGQDEALHAYADRAGLTNAASQEWEAFEGGEDGARWVAVRSTTEAVHVVTVYERRVRVLVVLTTEADVDRRHHQLGCVKHLTELDPIGEFL